MVQRRLKLANVSPRLMADYRADAVTLDQLMALAITDDHAAQEARSTMRRRGSASPSNLRERLTEREIDATGIRWCASSGWMPTSPQAAAFRRDLFAEGDAGVYLTDAALLERLAQDKLAGMRRRGVRAEAGRGWMPRPA